MAGLLTTLLFALFGNAAIAFVVALFWQAKVISIIYDEANWKDANSPWKALADENSPQNKFGYFLAGEFQPELRQKWWKAILYLIISFASLFLFAGLVLLLAPETLS